jgi:sialic acid synthase SpsE/sugar phosphate isomerase/epimerase
MSDRVFSCLPTKGKTLVIAEIGNNHNGSHERAIELIDLAQLKGADVVKFQMRHLDEVYRKRSLSKSGEDLSTEYVIDLLNRFELSKEEHASLAEYCKGKGIPYMCTPWDASSITVLESLEVPAYKVASADLTNLPLLSQLAKTRKPLILSTGMSTRAEIEITVKYLEALGVEFALLHCNSTYPAPYHDINLSWLSELKNIHSLVGYSGHERGIAVTLGAVALGARIVERHFTLDRNMEGPDHAASLEAEEFGKLVDGIRQIEEAMGEASTERKLSQGEMINRENLAKSMMASVPLSKGTVITPEHIKVRSPGQGLSPQHFQALIGTELKRDVEEEGFFFSSDIEESTVKAREYRFSRPWGVPVRYHDFNEYHELVKPDIFEFHLSYSDMELKPDDFLTGTYECGFVVHAPELFQGSHLMDLATDDDEYRATSMMETQRTIDITRDLKRFFPSTERPCIVANIGGFTMDGLLSKETVERYYRRFSESLAELDLEGVELIPQTMAPFPWHFGGQRYQNLFVHADEIVHWCEKLNLRMCFDISHSRLSCNHFKYDFYEFAKKVAPYTAHLHLGDASGVNGEGLQIGDGDLDFVKLGKILEEHCPDAMFIPEIWQGHKNRGEGFWIALERLEGVI